MKLVENWTDVLLKSASLWCLYIAGIALGLHEYIGVTDNGALPDAMVAQVDGWLKSIAFIAGAAAIPARVIQQASLKK